MVRTSARDVYACVSRVHVRVRDAEEKKGYAIMPQYVIAAWRCTMKDPIYPHPASHTNREKEGAPERRSRGEATTIQLHPSRKQERLNVFYRLHLVRIERLCLLRRRS